MQTGSVTTPFGRRPMTLALVKRQVATNEIKAGKSVEKWKVFRDASEAREELGLQSNSLAVLDALLSFYTVGDCSWNSSAVSPKWYPALSVAMFASATAGIFFANFALM